MLRGAIVPLAVVSLVRADAGSEALGGEMQPAVHNWEDYVEQGQDAVGLLHEKAVDTRSSNRDLIVELEDAEVNKRELRDAIALVRSENKQAKKVNRKLKKHVAYMTKRNKAMIRRHKKLEKRVKVIVNNRKKHVENITKDIEVLETGHHESMSQLQKEHDEVTESLAASKASSEELDGDVSELEAELKREQGLAAEEAETCNNLTETVDQLKAEISEGREENTRHFNEMDGEISDKQNKLFDITQHSEDNDRHIATMSSWTEQLWAWFGTPKIIRALVLSPTTGSGCDSNVGDLEKTISGTSAAGANTDQSTAPEPGIEAGAAIMAGNPMP